MRASGGGAEGASTRARDPGQGTARPSGRRDEDGLAGLVGPEMVAAVAALAGRAWRLLGDDVIEWAADGGGIWLLQSQHSSAGARASSLGSGSSVRVASVRSSVLAATP